MNLFEIDPVIYLKLYSPLNISMVEILILTGRESCAPENRCTLKHQDIVNYINNNMFLLYIVTLLK